MEFMGTTPESRRVVTKGVEMSERGGWFCGGGALADKRSLNIAGRGTKAW